MSKVKIVTSEGEIVELDIEIASILIKGIIDDIEANQEISLPNIKRSILNKIIEFCVYIKDNSPPEIEKPLRSNNLSDVTTPWYAEFVNLDQEVLFELILAANFLNIKPLLELSSAKVASLIKDQPIPEIKKFFNIDELTPEEEA